MQSCVQLERVLLETVAELDALGAEFRVLKGTAVAHLDYPDPSWRGFGDIDLLVRPMTTTASSSGSPPPPAPADDPPRYAQASTAGTARVCA